MHSFAHLTYFCYNFALIKLFILIVIILSISTNCYYQKLNKFQNNLYRAKLVFSVSIDFNFAGGNCRKIIEVWLTKARIWSSQCIEIGNQHTSTAISLFTRGGYVRFIWSEMRFANLDIQETRWLKRCHSKVWALERGWGTSNDWGNVWLSVLIAYWIRYISGKCILYFILTT